MSILDNERVRELSALLKDNAAQNRYLISDLVLEQDGQTLQFANLVMEGGGTLGIALVGYVYALEQANIRFLSVGGSSVGAIVALLLSCIGNRTEEKGPALAELLSEMDMASFIDGNAVARALSRKLGNMNTEKWKLPFILLFLLSLNTLLKYLGLNPGERFLDWLVQCLADAGVHTMEEAQILLDYLPDGLVHRTRGSGFAKPETSLKLVVADLTTSSKVIFPEMAPLYWEDPKKINPARFVRASMSIPFFFQPMEVRGVSKISDIKERWAKLCSFDGEVPDRITFSDGGLLSNFPISLFHQERVPDVPTLGARLGSSSRTVKEISTLGGLLGNMISALRHYSDYEFIYNNPDYSRLLGYIPTEAHSWLNFQMSEAEKQELFIKGMVSAYDFLETFDWPTYKQIRREQIDLNASLSRFGWGSPRRRNSTSGEDNGKENYNR